MFLPPDAQPDTGLRPDHSQISAADWDVLADFWYPVAIAAEIGDAPVKVRLLDVELVLFRGKDGTLAVARDLCPHRHVRLSGGKVTDGQIECPFHGLRFDTDGQCRLVPALGRQAKLPASYQVRTFPSRQRYGLLWTCLGDREKHQIPDLPVLAATDPADLTYGVPSIWPISAPRQVENFIDLAHLPFVHANTIGGDQQASLAPGRVEHTDDAVILHANYVESGPEGRQVPSTYRYRVVLPFTVDFTATHDADPENPLRSSDFAVPVSAYETLVFQVHKVDGDMAARQGLVNALDAVNKEDIVVLKGLARPDLPLDQRHEIHLPVDNISSQYRLRLRQLGLGQRAGGKPLRP